MPHEDDIREERIETEIIVDAYDEEERALGWYYYLESTLSFPFLTRCTAQRAISPLEIGDEVEVFGLASAEECRYEMFVTMPWGKRDLAVPLSQLEVTHGEDKSKEAVEDWRYWAKKGYEF